MTLSVMRLSTDCHDTECHLCQVSFKYLRYSSEASDFGHKQGDTVQNFVKTESFRPRKTSWNTVNFC